MKDLPPSRPLAAGGVSGCGVSGMGTGVPRRLWWSREKRRWGSTGEGGCLIYIGRRGGHAFETREVDWHSAGRIRNVMEACGEDKASD